MTVPRFRQYMVDKIRTYHANHLGWISGYTEKDPKVLAGAEELQKAFGYRFVIRRFAYTASVERGGTLDVSLQLLPLSCNSCVACRCRSSWCLNIIGLMFDIPVLELFCGLSKDPLLFSL